MCVMITSQNMASQAFLCPLPTHAFLDQRLAHVYVCVCVCVGQLECVRMRVCVCVCV